MKLLTFLGKGGYRKTTYVWDDYRCETEFVAEALATWLSADKVVLFLTKDAAQHENWKRLSDRLQGREVETVPIPDGRTEQEIWDIFDAVVSSVERRDEIAIDVTHAFRSLPMVLVAVAAFLRTVKEVRVRHIFYGCYMEGEPESPVIDLNLLLELLDWMEATRRFKETGDARWIGQALKDTHNGLRREKKGEPRELKKAGDRLITLSQALHLARPIEAAKAAGQLHGELLKASEEIHQWTKPFSLLLNDLQAQVERLACENTDILDRPTLEKQLQFIEELHQYGLVMQAAQMAREWVVNWAMWYSHGEVSLSQGEWLDPCRRGYIECVLSNAFRAGEKVHPPDWLKDPDLVAILRRLWLDTVELRNDLAHCGMRKQPLSSEDLYNQGKNLLPQLRDLWQKSEP